ncbi:hypothetical protein Hanom_Chr06g00506891 [Helianthus anomalus]
MRPFIMFKDCENVGIPTTTVLEEETGQDFPKKCVQEIKYIFSSRKQDMKRNIKSKVNK